MKLGNEYTKTCPVCKSLTVRRKKGKDWTAYQKLARGYFPETFIYYICDRCDRTWIEEK